MVPRRHAFGGDDAGRGVLVPLRGAERDLHGDVVIGMDASGLHSNGYSLVRAVIAAQGLALDTHVDDFGRSLGQELLEPTRIYTADLLAVLGDERSQGAIHALSHVTGGGLAANLARVMPRGLAARVDRSTWEPASVFAQMSRWGSVPQLDLEGTLNMGIGMVALVGADQADSVLAVLAERGLGARVIGEVIGEDALPEPGTPLEQVITGAKGVEGGAVLLASQHPGWA